MPWEGHGKLAWQTAYTIASILFWFLNNETNLEKKKIASKDQVFQLSQKESTAETFLNADLRNKKKEF